MISRTPSQAALVAMALSALAAPAAAQPAEPPVGASEPELISLATPIDIAAAGEATVGSGASEEGKSVQMDGETIPVEEREIRLEGTPFRAHFRRDPEHVPK